MSDSNYSIGGIGTVPEATPMANPVAGTKLLMKRSDTQGKKPAANDAEYGELFVNYHSNSPMLCFKDNAGTIVEIRPLTEVELALGELTDVDTSGATNGMVLSYNGSTWVPVSAASIAIDVDLGYTPAADKGTVTNSAGDDATIPLATGTNAGLSLNNYTTTEKNKLSGIEAGADANVNPTINFSTLDGSLTLQPGGDSTNIPNVTTSARGLMSSGDKIKLNGIEDGANVNVNADWNASSGDAEILNKPTLFSGSYDDLTNKPDIPEELSDLDDVDTAGATNGQLLRYNGTSWGPGSPGAVSVDLGYTAAADKGTVTNDAGSNAEIPIATGAYAGLSLHNYSAADKSKLDGLPDPGAITDGTVTSVDSGNGLTGGPITDAGTLSVLADGDTITVGATGIKVTDGKFASPGDIPDVSLYLPLAGGNMTGGVTATVRTITAGAFDLATGNLWECAGISVPNPTNAVAGMTGVIVFSAAPTAFGSSFKFPDGTPIAPSAFPAVAPFYVKGSSEILIGKAVEGIA